MPADPPAEELEQWTYLGRRRLTGGKLGYLWRDAGGRELAYPGLKAHAPGATYTVTVRSRDEDGSAATVAAVVTFAEAAPAGDEETARLVLADREAHLADEVRRAEARERKDAGERLGDLNLREIRDGLLRQGGPHRSARLALIINYLNA